MPNINEITLETARNLLPERKAESNKGTYGKVLNIAGCMNYQGAAYLSSVAPLKVGAGLVTLATIESVINNLASSAPWITFFPLRDCDEKCIASDAFLELKEVIADYDVLSVGPGLSDKPAVGEFVIQLVKYLEDNDKKIVLDADALNVLAKQGIEKFPNNSVITPHPMELSRLINISVDDIQADRIKYAKYTAEKFGCTVVLKGNRTIVCTKNFDIYVNTSGNSALAKAGSGDVLTGIIAGYMSQGLEVEDASILGVYLHGLCGELASNDLTQYCVLATDQIDYIPKAIKKILGES